MLNKKLLGSVSSLPQDDNFENVTLLLNGDGTNGAQNNTFLDSSTNNFTITRNGNTTQGSFSPYGSNWGNFFDGNGDYLAMPSNSAFAFGTGDFTIEMFVYHTTLSGQQTYYSDTFGDTAGVYFYKDSSNYVGVYYSSQIATSSTAIVGNQWNHIAVSRLSGTLKIFLNGTEVASVANSTDLTNTNANIGGVSGGSDWMSGYISNVRVLKGTGYSSITVPTAPLTAITNTSLLTCQSNRFIDNSTNAFAITVNGNTSVQRFSPFNPTAPYSTSVIGGSGYFDGSGDYLNTSATQVIPTGSFTVECWAYVTGSGADQKFVAQGTSGSAGRFSLGIEGGNWFVQIAGDLIQTGTPVKNQWNYVAVTYNGSTITLYVNGSSIGTVSSSANAQNTTLTIGQDWNSYTTTGYIASVRVSNTVRTVTTIPTAPFTSDGNTTFLGNMTNAGIPDLAMQNNLETVGNAQVSTSVKKYGTGSISFDGTADYLVTRNIAGTQLQTGDFTIECWAYFNSVSNGTILDKRAGDTRGILIYFGSSGTLSLAAGDSNSSAWEVRFDKSSLTTGVWYHVAFVRSGNNFYGFIDGTQISASQSSSMTIDDTGANYFIGTLSGGSEQLNAYIDDMRITKGVARYTANFTPPTKALETF